MPKFENFGSKFSKANVRFEISTFEIGDMPNLVKIRKLILFGPKCQNLSIWATTFRNTNVRFQISTLEIGYKRNFVQIKKVILFRSKYLNLGIWA